MKFLQLHNWKRLCLFVVACRLIREINFINADLLLSPCPVKLAPKCSDFGTPPKSLEVQMRLPQGQFFLFSKLARARQMGRLIETGLKINII